MVTKDNKDRLLTSEECHTYLAELNTLRDSLVLDTDPVAAGLDELNSKLARIQAARDRCSYIVCQAILNKGMAQKAVNSATAAYARKASELVTTSVEVKALKSADLRKASVDTQLADDVSMLVKAEESLLTADTLLRCVTVINKDLEVKNDNLVEQKYTIQMIMNVHPTTKGEFVN